MVRIVREKEENFSISKVELFQIRLPLKSPFKTSYGVLTEKAFDIICLTSESGHIGYGELVAFETPDYIEETLPNSRLIIKDHLLPLILNRKIENPTQIWEWFQVVRGNYMAKSAIETAVWDLYAKITGQSLGVILESATDQLEVGVSMGMVASTEELLKRVSDYVEEGYTRVKLKIKPGYDIIPLSAIRKKFPNLMLMADANSAYDLSHLTDLKALDSLNLVMIEQPFAADDFLDHAILQKELNTPLCLDENIRTVNDCRVAVALGSCRSINLKIPRVGGITEALKIIDYCRDKQILVWLGGMFESGVGRALNLQLASRTEFGLPGDISASDRYFYEDILEKPLLMEAGKMKVPQGLGIGVTVNGAFLQKNNLSYTWLKR
ncbi:o-succinylbenzoate synthase [Vagococcus intermedius]|uniref:o-succinylbenzoate synthase n=1 Tax=Vagococcus intermedius TaxID=2991418 RepID=A0AAF0CU11_9ENTE|nr:o-succinylbenzoate synthase [Vagococcus intermedius]WEG72837.1 o-succinylbenzoate synthase [Vagococcus intermedius]WEG74923.1 o-succinylbenzoate synthase [Vagococcus intermedius]